MAVPKKRTGHSAQGKRRSNWKAAKPALTICPNCGAKMMMHTVCTACGQYNGKVVSRKSEDFVEASAEVKETKKAPKKSTKKAAKAEKVEEITTEEVIETKEEAVEEVKEEAPAAAEDEKKSEE